MDPLRYAVPVMNVVTFYCLETRNDGHYDRNMYSVIRILPNTKSVSYLLKYKIFTVD
jgi:hypothetical protein